MSEIEYMQMRVKQEEATESWLTREYRREMRDSLVYSVLSSLGSRWQLVRLDVIRKQARFVRMERLGSLLDASIARLDGMRAREQLMQRLAARPRVHRFAAKPICGLARGVPFDADDPAGALLARLDARSAEREAERLRRKRQADLRGGTERDGKPEA